MSTSEQSGFEPWRQITVNRARAVRFDLDVRVDVTGEEYVVQQKSLWKERFTKDSISEKEFRTSLLASIVAMKRLI